jgi:hypothetical protein
MKIKNKHFLLVSILFNYGITMESTSVSSLTTNARLNYQSDFFKELSNKFHNKLPKEDENICILDSKTIKIEVKIIETKHTIDLLLCFSNNQILRYNIRLNSDNFLLIYSCIDCKIADITKENLNQGLKKSEEYLKVLEKKIEKIRTLENYLKNNEEHLKMIQNKIDFLTEFNKMIGYIHGCNVQICENTSNTISYIIDLPPNLNFHLMNIFNAKLTNKQIEIYIKYKENSSIIYNNILNILNGIKKEKVIVPIFNSENGEVTISVLKSPNLSTFLIRYKNKELAYEFKPDSLNFCYISFFLDDKRSDIYPEIFEEILVGIRKTHNFPMKVIESMENINQLNFLEIYGLRFINEHEVLLYMVQVKELNEKLTEDILNLFSIDLINEYKKSYDDNKKLFKNAYKQIRKSIGVNDEHQHIYQSNDNTVKMLMAQNQKSCGFFIVNNIMDSSFIFAFEIRKNGDLKLVFFENYEQYDINNNCIDFIVTDLIKDDLPTTIRIPILKICELISTTQLVKNDMDKDEFLLNLLEKKNIQFFNLLVELFNQKTIDEPEESLFPLYTIISKPRNEIEEKDEEIYDKKKNIYLFSE